ncbi:type VII secretion protein EccE [Tessaracoccus aquimaris]|uniref:Type VII secretion protein EccE n=1 Tax=Tessaracoccus aquimaris TaxID=1332264 RepID=A0A1Q2CRM4_9ACTN|nr:type VII secretion protein EccE [Tessaracoccus aquimaris]AQP48773.1 type VII secretion protein EccE [Tessaracoccus aquimaris]
MLRKTPPPRSTLQRRTRSTRYIGMVVAWQVVLVVIVPLVLLRQPWSIGVAAALLLVAILLTVPVNGRTLGATLRIRRRFRARARHRVQRPDVAPGLVPLAQWVPKLELTQIKDAHDGEIGVVADGDSWCGLLEVTSDNSLFTDRGAKLDLAILGSLTRQDDVVFAGIQVVTYTVPGPAAAMLPATSPAIQAYREVAGNATPPAIRRTWIALRLDPRLCLEAVDRRGSGQVGVFATLRFGLHRAQATLKRHGMPTEPLDPIGIADVLALTTGAADVYDGERSSEGWEQWTCDSLTHRTRGLHGFGEAPSALYQGLLDVATQTPAMFCVTSLTVAPGEPPRGAMRLVSPNPEQAVTADEFVLAAVPRDLRIGPLGGNQVPGLLATIPLGRQIDQ